MYLTRPSDEYVHIYSVLEVTLALTQFRYFCLDPYVFPAGCDVVIPIGQLHNDPKGKVPRGSFIPFSFGVRNYIGFKYGMMSAKYILASILREFKVRSVGLETLDDIEWEFIVVLKPKNSRLVFEKRTH
ncbi:hypothetical protein Zmor_012884 [Zophobas morio]|uniref:Cytochrome P450 n=1 Tax=Zophobas morio TaxID=2755281 RepID=A0AA38IEC6_9CUCU|nr:hypothetical protein Zmor_012884 [Zophobas morio]